MLDRSAASVDVCCTRFNDIRARRRRSADVCAASSANTRQRSAKPLQRRRVRRRRSARQKSQRRISSANELRNDTSRCVPTASVDEARGLGSVPVEFATKLSAAADDARSRKARSKQVLLATARGNASATAAGATRKSANANERARASATSDALDQTTTAHALQHEPTSIANIELAAVGVRALVVLRKRRSSFRQHRVAFQRLGQRTILACGVDHPAVHVSQIDDDNKDIV